MWPKLPVSGGFAYICNYPHWHSTNLCQLVSQFTKMLTLTSFDTEME